MSFKLIDDGDYTLGVIKDIAAWQLPRGALSDALNMIFDQPGIARQRGGVTALVAGAQTASPTSFGFCYSQDGTPIEELYGFNGKTGDIVVINKTTGAFTTVLASGNTNITVGRAARHFGFAIFPTRGASFRHGYALAGQTSTTTFVSTAAVTLTVGQQQITLGGADLTTNLKVGAIITAGNASNAYYGRIVSIDTTTKFTVWPAPPVTFTTSAAGLTAAPAMSNLGGACATSFQNRLLYGNTNDLSSTGKTLSSDRRIYYSPLPTETVVDPTGVVTYSGSHYVNAEIWPAKNFIELSGGGPIVAMEPVDNDELLILTTDGAWIFRGELATQTTTFAPGVTFDLFPLNTTAGCLSDLSVQRTPQGIVWASSEGIMIYRGGGKIDNLTEERIHTEWIRLTNVASFAIHGAGYVGNHYIITGAPGYAGAVSFAWAVNLNGNAWGNLGNIDWFYSVARPTNPAQVYGLRWWLQSGAAPSMTNGQTHRIDSIFAADVWGQTKTDGASSFVPILCNTRVLTDDPQVMRILRLISARYQADFVGGSGSLSVAVGGRLDASETAGVEVTSVGVLSNTAALTLSGATNATPIVITTTINHGYQSEDEVDIHCTGNLAANGRWRITVLSATTFSLNQSIGSGVFGSGDVKKVTEQTFTAAALGLDMGQGHWVSINNSNAINRFELHGLRMSVMEFGRGLGRAG